MEKTNIFKYAKKELSQDAVICSILAKEDQRAKDFLSAMIISRPIESKEAITLPESFEIVPNSLKQQDGKIDIFLEVSTEDEVYAVIIEDKTDTAMHDQQMTQYISRKLTEREYKGCFFILFKTGKIPFWEIDNYKDEIHSIQTGNLEDWQFVKPKSRDAIIEQISNLKVAHNNKIRFSVFSRDIFEQFLKEHTWDDCAWMQDYIAYISDRTLDSTIVLPWMEEYSKTTKTFASTISKGMWERLSIYTPKAGGKRSYDFAFEGIGGSAAREFRASSRIKEAYYFLPLFRFQDDSSARIQLNFHAYQNENDVQGYCSVGDYRPEIKSAYQEYRKLVFEKLKEQLDADKWTFANELKYNSLKLCHIEVHYSPDDILNENIEGTELQNRVCELLKAVFRIRAELFNE